MNKSTWRFSAKDSAIEFKIKYYKISSLTGYINDFWGNVTANDDFSTVDINVSLETGSINANNVLRNKKLRSPDCLHAKKYPNMEFTAINGCRLSEGNIREVKGNLTIKDITSEVTLVINYTHAKKGAHSPVMVLGLFGCISRKDFNLHLEEDNLDDEIHLTAMIELSRSETD